MDSMQDIEKELREVPMGSQIRVFRDEIQDGYHRGYLLGMGGDFLALQLVDDSIHLDGFAALRIADVTSFESPDPYGGFVERALELRGEKVAPSCPFELSTIETVLRSAESAHGLVTIHSVEDTGICFIGECTSIEDGSLTMKTITPDAEWDDEMEIIELEDVCEVSVGDAYSEALSIVNESPG